MPITFPPHRLAAISRQSSRHMMDPNKQQRAFAVFPERAGCPHCGIPLPRSLFFTKLPFARHQAKCCGGGYRINASREFLTGALYGQAWAICFLLGWLEFISWTVAGLTIAAIFSFAYALSPYLTLVAKAHSADDRRVGRAASILRRPRRHPSVATPVSPGASTRR